MPSTSKASKKTDNPKPRRPLSAYNLFFQERRTRVQETSLRETAKRVSFADIARIVATEWKKTSKSEKAYYEQIAAKEKLRFALEVVQWKNREAELASGSMNETITKSASRSNNRKETIATKTQAKISGARFNSIPNEVSRSDVMERQPKSPSSVTNIGYQGRQDSARACIPPMNYMSLHQPLVSCAFTSNSIVSSTDATLSQDVQPILEGGSDYISQFPPESDDEFFYMGRLLKTTVNSAWRTLSCS